MQRHIFVLMLFTMSVFAQKQPLTFEFATSNDIYPATASQLDWYDEMTPTWLHGDYEDRLFAFRNNKIDTLFTIDELNRAISLFGKDSLEAFPRGKWIEQAYHFATKSAYWRYDPVRVQIHKLFAKPKGSRNWHTSPQYNYAIFTMHSNLFLMDSSGDTTRLTDDGGGDISYGISVHQREFGIRKGVFWSAAENYVAFYREDKSKVHKYPYIDYTLLPAAAKPDLYPMAGQTNTTVTVWLYDLSEKQKVVVQTGAPADQYFTNLTFTPDGDNLLIAHVNRGQNQMDLVRYHSDSGAKDKILFTEKHENYVEPQTAPFFMNGDDDHFLWMSRRDGYNHVYLYDNDGNLERQVTSGQFVIQQLMDVKGDWLFVRNNRPGYLYSVIERIDLNSGKGVLVSAEKGWYSGKVNPDGSQIIASYSAMDNPGELQLLRLQTNSKKVLNASVDPARDHAMPTVEIGSILAADNQTKLATRTLYPSNFDKNSVYPVIVYVYGGPHAQLIQDRWLAGARPWLHYLAESGYIVFTVDSRGSANRGLDFEQAIFRNLAEVEVADQMAGVDYLKSKAYVDSTRIGVHGWSYGGYMTLNMMLKTGNTFKVGVAGAPVTDWKYYESVYTERYMDTPEENPDGFKSSSTLNVTDNLQGRLLVIHGTNDSVVMLQHSVVLLKAFIKSMKVVDFMVYPGHNHGIRGNDRVHLYKTMTTYFDDHLR
jgi:dipeptidyl-peptidase-4